MNYAIIESGGKQFRVEDGSVILVEKLDAEVGSTVSFERVLLLCQEGKLSVGNPYLKGLQVTGLVQEQGKHKKIRVFKYKAKSNYRRRSGHRQPFTRVCISLAGLLAKQG